MTAIFSICFLSSLTTKAHAEEPISPFSHEPGITFSLLATRGINSDDTTIDFQGTFGGILQEIGFLFPNGTEPFVAAGVHTGGKGVFWLPYGAGVRQRVRIARVEPFLEVGYFNVANQADLPMALALNLGANVPLGRAWTAGVSGGHYFSSEEGTVMNSYSGALDWHVTMRLTWVARL